MRTGNPVPSSTDIQQEMEIQRLRKELEASRAEQMRLSSSLSQVEEAARRSGDELRMCQQVMQQKEEKFRQEQLAEQARVRQSLEQYHEQYLAERNRLAEALKASSDVASALAQQHGAE
eukprot:CAMPEP_0181339682 /NCGR_PEP_ID=MMETSP1101-20121128/29411_1 /TAXON_ID=46948 /ORGANISM="Rhodomonas abbreviata, Strain Caron Lab Isolate" /LENGTH=118 /DNA_ID=CAMNT_0023450717 /DNA_START=140 /DNA_END=496 /DNA_ORIENTATION=+